MCLMDAPSAPPTPEPPAPPAAPIQQTPLEIDTKAKRRSEEKSAAAEGTRRFKVKQDSEPTRNMSGLNIPT